MVNTLSSGNSTPERPVVTGGRTGLATSLSSDQLAVAGLGKELTLSKSLDRAESGARLVVTTVALAGTVLTGFGLTAANEVGKNDAAQIWALLSLGTGFAALVLALSYLQLRVSNVNVHDLVEMQAWLDAKIRRVWCVRLAGLLLVVAVGFAGIGALATILDPDHNAPAYVLQQRPTTKHEGMPGRHVTGSVACSGCTTEVRHIELVVKRGSTERRCYDAFVSTDGDGDFDVEIPSCSVGQGAVVTLVIDGEEIHSLP